MSWSRTADADRRPPGAIWPDQGRSPRALFREPAGVGHHLFCRASLGLVVVPLDSQTWSREVWSVARFTESKAILASESCFRSFTPAAARGRASADSTASAPECELRLPAVSGRRPNCAEPIGERPDGPSGPGRSGLHYLYHRNRGRSERRGPHSSKLSQQPVRREAVPAAHA